MALGKIAFATLILSEKVTHKATAEKNCYFFNCQAQTAVEIFL